MSWLGGPTPSSAATAAAVLPASLRHRVRGHVGGDASSSSARAGPSSIAGPSSPSPAARPRGRRRKGSGGKNGNASLSQSHNHTKGWVQAAFRRFGEHCARNQIRTLLIDCLVMTNLFYPSFAMFLERQFNNTGTGLARAPAAALRQGPAPGACGNEPTKCTPCWLFSGGLRDSFYPPPPPLIPNVEWGPWWAAESGATAKWVPVAGRSGSDTSVELLRVAWTDVGDVLDAEHDTDWTPRDDEIISAVKTLADEWGRRTGQDAARCVRRLVSREGATVPDGPCYLISPNNSERIPGATNLDALWGFEGNEVQQMYRGLIIPFHKPANQSAFEAAWTEQLARVVAPNGAEVFTETYAGGKHVQCETLVTFSSNPTGPMHQQISTSPPRFVLVIYVFLLGALLFQISNASKVHSRFGLAFTGVVQLLCSTVMSFSVLALLGWNGWGWSKGETVLPTYTLPFVIVVVGAENMSALTKAVFSVPFTYSVPVRMGKALSKVGSTIALTSLTDLALLGLVWLCVHLQPVREFCVFAAVVIITDWFMLHTFFLTVLSIDAQRLELADVLASNGAMSSADLRREEDEADRRASRKATRFSWRSVLRARTAKSGSLLLLLTSVVVLYYYTEPGRTKFNTPAALYGYKPSSTSALAPSARPSSFVTAAELNAMSPSESLWMALNPNGLSSVRVSLPPSSIVVFPRIGHSLLPADIRKLSLPVKTFKLPRLEPLWYWVKMGLLPQAVTCIALYCVLLYLLKDSDLLDAQRNRLGRGGEPHASDDESDDGGNGTKTSIKAPIMAGVGVNMLPASHESDVDLLAASADGSVALSIGVDNSICLWRFLDEDRLAGTRENISTDFIANGDPIVAAAVSKDGMYAGIVTRSGLVQFWSTPSDERKTEALGPVNVGTDGMAVALAFDESPLGSEDPFAASPTERGPRGQPILIVGTSDGAIHAVLGGNRVIDIAPRATSEKGVYCRVDLLATNAGPLAIVSTPNRTIMWRKEHGEWSSVPLMTSCEPGDRVTAVATGLVDWQRPTDVVVLGRRSGQIEVFDDDGERMSEPFGQEGEVVRALAVSAPAVTRCSTCDTKASEGFFVISSSAEHVFVDRILPRDAESFCRCPPPLRRPAVDDALARSPALTTVVLPPSARVRTVSGGFNRNISATLSPIKTNGSLAPPSNGEFPLSSHGSRRLSGWRESSEPPRPPSPLDRQGSYTALSTLAMSAPDDSAAPTASARPAWDEARVVPLGAIVAVDGGWEILDHQLVGVRRAGAGIDDSQWQLWAVDLCAPWNGATLLVDAAGLDVLEKRTRTATAPRHGPTPPPSASDGEMPMRARRAERLLSLNGRASFPSSVGSFTVPTHLPLGYVAVRPFRVAGARSILAGFGNRVGVLTLPPRKQASVRIQPLNAPRVVTPRRSGFPAPPPPRRAENGTGNGAGGGIGMGNGMGNGLSTPK